jgi:hypothetical protein
MASKVGRIIPLAISVTVLAVFLINFKYYGLDFYRHFYSGAGLLTDEFRFYMKPFSADLYLHLSLFSLFLGGVFLFFGFKRLAKLSYSVISILMLVVFLLRPVISLLLFHFLEYSYGFSLVFLPTLKGQLIGNYEINYQNEMTWSVQQYLSGIVLLLLLLTNLLLSFFHKQDPVHSQQRQTRVTQPRYAQPMPVQSQGPSISMTQELERLQQIYQSGALTEEEFTVAKKRVLGN